MATHSSILAWENPMDAGVWQVHGFTRVRHDLAATAPALTASVYTLKGEAEVAQSWPAFCDPMNYTVHGILQARILEWVTFPSPGDLPKPGIRLRSPTLQADSLPAEPLGKPASV